MAKSSKATKPPPVFSPPGQQQQRAAVGKALVGPANAARKAQEKAAKKAAAEARADELHLMMEDGIDNDRLQYLARRERPLVAQTEGVKEYRAMNNIDLVNMMFSSFCKTYGFVPGRSILQSLGFAVGGLILCLIAAIWLDDVLLPWQNDFWKAVRVILVIASTVGGAVGGFWLARFSANGNKFTQAYAEFMIIEFGDRNNERAITGSADGYLPRLSFATTSGYMKGHSEASGIRHGFALMWTDYNRPLRHLRMADIMGVICPACDDGGFKVTVPNPHCKSCIPPLPPLSGLDLINIVGERFYGNAADTMFSLIMQAFEAGELRAARGRRNSLFKQIKGWVIWLIIILLIVFNFLAFAVGLDAGSGGGG